MVRASGALVRLQVGRRRSRDSTRSTGPRWAASQLLRGRSDDADTKQSGGPRPDVREVSRPAQGCPDSLRAGVPVRRLLLEAVPADPGGGPDAAGRGAGGGCRMLNAFTIGGLAYRAI